MLSGKLLQSAIFVLIACSRIRTTYGQSFEPHLHPKSERPHRQLTEGFHADIDDISISAGFQHSCGIQSSGQEFGGTITCWGFNQKGQAAPPPGTFIQVSCGYFHSCGLTIDEEVKCWGAPGIGRGVEGQFLQVSAGGFHTCAVKKNGQLQCWGKDYDGQVSAVPEGTFVQVSAGKTHNCAIATDGTAHCWGSNSWWESQPPEGHQFTQLSASLWHHTCGVTIDGDALCWGADGFGQSGRVPRQSFTLITTGRKFTCGILANTEAICWGMETQFDTTVVPAGTTWATLSSGYMHTCGITMANKAICFGNDVGTQASVPTSFIPAV